MAGDVTINHWPQIFRQYPGQPELEIEVLRGQYKVLSQFHLPQTKHKLLFTVEPMMDYLLYRVQQLSLQLVKVEADTSNIHLNKN